jgi:RNA polymerase sigma factor (TIGR02999 family)
LPVRPPLPQNWSALVSDSTVVSRLLLAWRAGDAGARDQLLSHVYDELHRMAEGRLRSEDPGHTLQATALIHEAFLRLVDADVQWTSRGHFFALAAGVMRRILVDHAKARRREKRGGGGARVTLDEALLVTPEPAADLVALDDALTRLQEMDERKAKAVELHYFGGLTYEETAEVLGISAATVDRELRMAKAWLYRELAGSP